MQREPTLLDLCVQRVGIVRGGHLVVMIGQWALAMAEAGDDWPMGDTRGVETDRVRRYRDTAARSEPSAWRHLAKFRKAFPGETDPTRIVLALGLVQAVEDARSWDPMSVAFVPAGAV